jgi:hypothetical protein
MPELNVHDNQMDLSKWEVPRGAGWRGGARRGRWPGRGGGGKRRFPILFRPGLHRIYTWFTTDSRSTTWRQLKQDPPTYLSHSSYVPAL